MEGMRQGGRDGGMKNEDRQRRGLEAENRGEKESRDRVREREER
jgi:hypothetical protein